MKQREADDFFFFATLCKTILVQLFLLSKNAIIPPSSFCFFQNKDCSITWLQNEETKLLPKNAVEELLAINKLKGTLRRE